MFRTPTNLGAVVDSPFTYLRVKPYCLVMNIAQKLASLSGISPKGNIIVQTRQGGGYMLLQRRDQYAGWIRVGETEFYATACRELDVFVARHGDVPAEPS